MPPKIKTLARQILKDPVEISIAMSKPPDKILQQAYMVYDEQKIPLIQFLLKEKLYKGVLIFAAAR
ncbi:hypothetical protein LWM68_07795 [Niabella sp. W65]|nr:hypothetical protein [Niabella sp. W65]MCH7362676.1 hypothetical protein [Niabella sp. W65]ULT38631.1 hypothetical protein KRR40_26455 [Niabella sp. I65]